mgnify:CR=1 FL=1
MNIITCVKSMTVATVISFSNTVLGAEKANFPSRIENQSKAVEAARKAKEINFVESRSLKKEIEAIKTMYKLYLKDKKISEQEAKMLNSKLNNSDVNLFRKKYD